MQSLALDFLNRIVDFLTDPNSLGFPILIAGGLVIILYLMKKSTSGWHKADKQVAKKKDSFADRNYPYKPF